MEEKDTITEQNNINNNINTNQDSKPELNKEIKDNNNNNNNNPSTTNIIDPIDTKLIEDLKPNPNTHNFEDDTQPTPIKSKSINFTESDKEKLIEMLSNTIYTLNLESNYNNKELLVSNLMVNLHEIISDTEKIKSQMPKSKVFPKYPYKKVSNKIMDDQLSSLSVISKRSTTSTRSKIIGSNNASNKYGKNNTSSSNNKFNVLSPKVSITIGGVAKNNLNSSSKNNNNNSNSYASSSNKTMTKNNSVKRLENNLSGTAKSSNISNRPNNNTNYSSNKNIREDNINTNSNSNTLKKKINNKKSNMSNPNPKNNTTTNTNTNTTNTSQHNFAFTNKKSTSIKVITKSIPINSPSLESKSIAFKFEPKKKTPSSTTNHTHTNTGISTSYLNQQSDDLSPTILSNNQMNQILTTKKSTGIEHNSVNDTNTNNISNSRNHISYIISARTNYNNPKTKDFLDKFNKLNVVFSFLDIKDRKKLRNLSINFNKQYKAYEILMINNKMNICDNPFSRIALNMVDDKKQEHDLNKLNCKTDEEDKNLNVIIKAVYSLYCNSSSDSSSSSSNNSNKSLEEKISEIKASYSIPNSTTSPIKYNLFELFNRLLKKTKEDKELYQKIKTKYNSIYKKELEEILNIDNTTNNNTTKEESIVICKYYIQLFQEIKTKLDERESQMENLLDHEILLDKIERINGLVYINS